MLKLFIVLAIAGCSFAQAAKIDQAQNSMAKLNGPVTINVRYCIRDYDTGLLLCVDIPEKLPDQV